MHKKLVIFYSKLIKEPNIYIFECIITINYIDKNLNY